MKGRRKTIVFAAGTFDGLHPGHIAFLKYAKKQGSELCVVVARDSSVKRVRGRKPLFGEKQRLELVCSIGIVDKAFWGSEKSWFDSVEKINPGIIVLGHDQKIDLQKLEKFIQEKKLRTKKILRAPETNRKNFSGSRLRSKKPGFQKKI